MRELWTIRQRALAILVRAIYDPIKPMDSGTGHAPAFIYRFDAQISVYIWPGNQDEIVAGTTTRAEYLMAQKLAQVALGNVLKADAKFRRALRNPLSMPAMVELVMAFITMINPVSPFVWGTHANDIARERAADSCPEEAGPLLRASKAQCEYAKYVAEEALGAHPHTWSVLD
jgi:hypothetical protein